MHRRSAIFLLRFSSFQAITAAGIVAAMLGTLLEMSPAQAVPAAGHQIMVAGPSPYAVEIARDIHARGGNVADVAVAIALSLSVTHPYYAALGGGGFAMVKMGKDVQALDFREKAPAKADSQLFQGHPLDSSRTGGLAVAVPGVPAGLWALHQKYGKLKWAELFEGAIRLADKGFPVSGEWVDNTEYTKKRFQPAGLKFFAKAKGESYQPGETLKQPALAEFLREFRKSGESAFYQGKVAKEIAKSVTDNGGLLTTEDLATYHVRWLQPMKASYRGYQLDLMPPPSSGGVIIAQALKLMEKTELVKKKPLSVEEFHALVEILKLSYRGRGLLGDPDFAKLPIKALLSEAYTEKQLALFKPDHALDVSTVPELSDDKDFQLSGEKDETTHFSVMDAKGNAIAMTITLNGDYGSAMVSDKTGIALNNEMDDFTTQLGKPNMFGLIQGANNQVRAGARPLSSMTPTIVEKDGHTVLSIGAPGGPRITSGVLQVIYRLLTQPMNIDQAIQAPRVHHQFLPNMVKIDAFKFTPETIAALEAKGHKIDTGSTGKVAGIWLTEDGILQGACDARGECAAGGL